MSGHNKWSKIKNVKAKNEAQTSKMYTKIGREIAVAVKAGGSDPNSNAKLKTIACTWGFRTIDQLQGAHYFANTPNDIKNIIEELNNGSN